MPVSGFLGAVLLCAGVALLVFSRRGGRAASVLFWIGLALVVTGAFLCFQVVRSLLEPFRPVLMAGCR